VWKVKMVYGQDNLVPDDDELDWLLEEIAAFWNEGLSAKEIAEKMWFGETAIKEAKERGFKVGEIGYPHLKTRHIYYFVQKYGKKYGMLPKRKLKKEPEEEQKEEVKNGVPYTNDMPFEVAILSYNFRREK
jgi:hypothetical protein